MSSECPSWKHILPSVYFLGCTLRHSYHTHRIYVASLWTINFAIGCIICKWLLLLTFWAQFGFKSSMCNTVYTTWSAYYCAGRKYLSLYFPNVTLLHIRHNLEGPNAKKRVFSFQFCFDILPNTWQSADSYFVQLFFCFVFWKNAQFYLVYLYLKRSPELSSFYTRSSLDVTDRSLDTEPILQIGS